jgi:DNA-binding NarL/FixJ family response regulator
MNDNTASAAPTALLLSGDLFFTSKITGTAQAVGLCMDVRAAIPEEIPGPAVGGYRLVIIDLAEAAIAPAEVIARLSAADRPHVIAYGSHVATAKLKAARDAGCDEVLPRSRFSAELAEILRRATV